MLLLTTGLTSLLTRSPVVSKQTAGAAAPLLKLATGLTIAALVLAFGLELGMNRGGDVRTAVTTVKISPHSRDLTGVRLDLITRFGLVDRLVQVAAFPIDDATPRRSMYVFTDPALPYAGGPPALFDAVRSNLFAYASIEGPDTHVDRVDSSALVKTLRDTGSAISKVILILGGTFPAQAFSKTTDLVKPWVEAGGLLVWAGDAIGYYSVSPGDRLDPTGSKNPQAAGSQTLLGSPMVSFPTAFGRVGTAASPVASALALRYSQTSSGLVTSVLDGGGGLDLGFRGEGVTSIAYRPHGRGGYLLFGGRVSDAALIANDISRILFSNILHSNLKLAVSRIQATNKELTTATLHVDLRPSVHRVMVVATGSDTYPFFLTATTVDVGSVG